MKTLRKWFIAGLAVVLPAGMTVYILIWLFKALDGLLATPILWIYGEKIPGIGALAIILLLLVIGMLTSNYLGKKLVGWFHTIIEKTPIVGNVYKPISKIAASISSEKSKSFKKVVTIQFPSKDITSIGFITNENVSFAGGDEVCVFIPTTPNPTNGFLVFVKKDRIKELDISVSEGLNMVVSIGSVIPDNFPHKENELDLPEEEILQDGIPQDSIPQDDITLDE